MLAPRLSFELVEDRADFDALKSEWDRLHAAAGRYQLAFQSHAWLGHCWDAAARTTTAPRPAIVVVRRGASVCLICPFAVERHLAITRLVWMGEPASQYGDVLLDPAVASSTEIAAAFDHAIACLRPDLVHLRRVRADAAVAPYLRAMRATVTDTGAAPFMAFADAPAYDDYADKFTTKTRKNRRRLRRRLEEKGPVDVTVLAPGTAAADAMRLGLTFKHDWLARRGEIYSALRDPAVGDALAATATTVDDTLKPFVSVMTCAGEPISVQFGLITPRGLALHLIAYSPDWKKPAPVSCTSRKPRPTASRTPSRRSTSSDPMPATSVNGQTAPSPPATSPSRVAHQARSLPRWFSAAPAHG